MNDILSFGPFSLSVAERLLTREGTRLDLGGRTLDTLIALVSRANVRVGTGASPKAIAAVIKALKGSP